MNKNIRDFTTGSIPKALLYFSIPFFLTNLIQAFYSIADIMVISRFCGSSGIAGASIGASITDTITFTIVGLCNGGAIMTAQYAGMKNEKEIKETVSTTFGVMLILAVISTALTLISAPYILRALNTPAEAFDQTRSYFSICMIGSVFIFGYNAVGSVLRGLGDSKTPMYFGFTSCLLNIVLDLLLVGVFHMDVEGAAIATVASQAVALTGCILYLKKREFFFDFKPSSFRIYPAKAAKLFQLGLPDAIQSAIVSGGFLMVSSIINSLGVNAASGVSLASKVNNFAQMPATAVGMSVASMTGQNVGADKYDRVRSTLKYSIMICLAISTAMFAIVQLFPSSIMGLLVQDAGVINEALPYLRITALDYLLVALCFPLNGLCNGSGHTLFSMIPSIVSSVIVRVPVAYFCARTLGLGLLGVGIATPTGTFSAVIICTVYYFSNRWCKKVV